MSNNLLMIEVDRETFRRLQSLAEPLVDTPQTVLRRLVGLPPIPTAQRDESRTGRRSRTSKKGKRAPARGPRAPLGTLLPEREYELPILRYLTREGGQAPSRDVVNAVGRELSDKLTDDDREMLSSGGIRWENRVHFTRLRLVERGLIRRDGPRGVWALTEAGMSAVNNGTVPKP